MILGNCCLHSQKEPRNLQRCLKCELGVPKMEQFKASGKGKLEVSFTRQIQEHLNESVW